MQKLQMMKGNKGELVLNPKPCFVRPKQRQLKNNYQKQKIQHDQKERKNKD
jgi:hypothetical protein